MKRTIKFLLLLLTVLTIGTNISFASQDNMVTKDYIIEIDQEQDFESNIEKSFVDDNYQYQLNDIQKEYQKTKESKIETKEKSFNTSDGNYNDLYNTLEKTIYYTDDNNFNGQLNLVDIKIRTIDNGSYEEVKTLEKQYTNLNESDLDNIPKELVSNKLTYYLTSCNWEITHIKDVLDVEVPNQYTANAVYQAVATIKNPNTYSVTAIYQGEVEKDVINNIAYKVTYIGTKLSVDESNNISIPFIVSTGTIIILIPLFIFFFLPNTKIYFLDDKKYILVKKVRVRKNNPYVDLSHLKNGTYKIEFNQKFSNKIKGFVTIYRNNGQVSQNSIINNEIIVVN